MNGVGSCAEGRWLVAIAYGKPVRPLHWLQADRAVHICRHRTAATASLSTASRKPRQAPPCLSVPTARRRSTLRSVCPLWARTGTAPASSVPSVAGRWLQAAMLSTKANRTATNLATALCSDPKGSAMEALRVTNTEEELSLGVGGGCSDTPSLGVSSAFPAFALLP